MALSTNQLAALTPLLDRSLQAKYQEFRNVDNNWAMQFVKTIAVKKETVTFPWVHDLGLMRETRRGLAPIYEEASGFKAEITLRLWESAVSISAYDISEDDTGQLRDQASDIGRNAGLIPLDIVIEALIQGDSASYLMYDGQNYFDNAHEKKFGSGVTYDNLLAGVLNSANFQIVRTAMMQFPSDYGLDRPLNLMATHLIVPGSLEYTARELMNNTLNPNATFNTENVLKGMATVIAEARLEADDSNDWYLIANNGPTKPFIHVRHSDFSPFRIYPEIADSDPAFRDHHQRRWWGRTMETVYPSHPFYAIKVVN